MNTYFKMHLKYNADLPKNYKLTEDEIDSKLSQIDPYEILTT